MKKYQDGTWHGFSQPKPVAFHSHYYSHEIVRTYVLGWREVSEWDDDDGQYFVCGVEYLLDNGDTYRIHYDHKPMPTIVWEE
jgi:hypothetical protein